MGVFLGGLGDAGCLAGARVLALAGREIKSTEMKSRFPCNFCNEPIEIRCNKPNTKI